MTRSVQGDGLNAWLGNPIVNIDDAFDPDSAAALVTGQLDDERAFSAHVQCVWRVGNQAYMRGKKSAARVINRQENQCRNIAEAQEPIVKSDDHDKNGCSRSDRSGYQQATGRHKGRHLSHCSAACTVREVVLLGVI